MIPIILLYLFQMDQERYQTPGSVSLTWRYINKY